MADGYARASKVSVGVCIATSGPGATNLVTGIATAMPSTRSFDRPASLARSRPKSSARTRFQEIDITGITLPITKHNYLVTRAQDIAPTLREAFPDCG